MAKNGCSYFESSLVAIEFVLRFHRCLALAANFGQFVILKTALKKQESLELLNVVFENSSLKGIFGQNMSYPPKWLLTDDSRFLQAVILNWGRAWLSSYAMQYMCLVISTFLSSNTLICSIPKQTDMVVRQWSALIDRIAMQIYYSS